MATNKSYTDLEQSKTLSKILPLESADMWYSYYGNSKYNPTIAYKGQQWFLCQIRNSLHDDIPCWSLAALLGVLPYGYSSILTKSFNGKDYYCEIDVKPLETKADNPVDVCYEMILKLHELKIM